MDIVFEVVADWVVGGSEPAREGLVSRAHESGTLRSLRRIQPLSLEFAAAEHPRPFQMRKEIDPLPRRREDFLRT